MKYIIFSIALLFFGKIIAQQDSTNVYKKRVLETTEIDFLTSYYQQDGDNASVTGGIGDEHLTDFTPTIVVSMPLNADDVITVDAGISTYTSASSSNLDPFDRSSKSNNDVIGSPWVASSGASKQDTWGSITVDYSHSSDDRNTVWNVDASFATEFDYTSIGFGGGILQQFNDKNTTVGISANVYLDTWSPVYPIELKTYNDTNGNLNSSFFNGVTILDENGNASTNWQPINGFKLIDNKSRNSYSASFSFSQILNKNAQISVFVDLVKQQGWLSNPMQRVYFGDVANYYIGNSESIPNYTSPTNTDVFQLADDIERLPDNRFKIPIGLRLNYFLNSTFSLRTYYRYYFDDWGIHSHTASLEVPIKLSDKFTIYPSYRYYTQTQADYFAPYEQNISTSTYYTSDYDLSKFNANQYGFGVSYTDIFTTFHISKFGLKSIDLKYANYKRNTGLKANIISIGFKFLMD
ncbi:DUF3570 domain-containing protein [uncultured Formosa sp.]|uniref:DUF3570 domain-containing protein n=1 Tax=uncultured Formosa sp. TaxID=255435 RepID=UPI00261E9D7D|nr:DUF3570 domain-containing protein [uncultured Formosa sp.]